MSKTQVLTADEMGDKVLLEKNALGKWQFPILNLFRAQGNAAQLERADSLHEFLFLSFWKRPFIGRWD